MGVIFNGCVNYSRNAYALKPVPFTYGGDDMPIRFSRQYTNNGLVMYPLATSDFHIVADDLTPSSNWDSRIGTFSAPLVGVNYVDIETPFYPSGVFSGTGNRKSTGIFSGTAHYLFPNDAAHYINNTDYITYLCAVKAPRLGAANEVILNAAGVGGNNIVIYFDSTTLPGTIYIRGIVDFSITPCNSAVEIDPDAFTVFMFKFNPTTNELAIYTPNGSAFSTGVGVIDPPAGTGLFIGNDAFIHVGALSSGRIIEILRAREDVSGAVFNQYWWRWFGVVADTGQFPVAFQRSSPALIEVNKKYWKMGKFVPRINENGLLVESVTNSVLLNNFIQSGIASVWASFPTFGSTISDNSSDADVDIGVTEQCCEFAFDVSGSSALISQTTAVALTASTSHFVAISWKGQDTGCRIKFSIFCVATSRWYDVSSGSWVGPQVFNAITHSEAEKSTDHILFTSDTINSLYIVLVGSDDDVANAGKSIFLYSLTIGVGESRFNPVFSPGGSIGVSAADIPPAYASSGNIDYSDGKMNIAFIPENSSTELNTYVKSYFGATIDLIKQSVGEYKFTVDLGSALVETTDSYSAFEEMELQLAWNNPGFLMLTNLTKGSTDVDNLSVDIDSGLYFSVGGSYTTLNRINGYIKRIVIR